MTSIHSCTHTHTHTHTHTQFHPGLHAEIRCWEATAAVQPRHVPHSVQWGRPRGRVCSLGYRYVSHMCGPCWRVGVSCMFKCIRLERNWPSNSEMCLTLRYVSCVLYLEYHNNHTQTSVYSSEYLLVSGMCLTMRRGEVVTICLLICMSCNAFLWQQH